MKHIKLRQLAAGVVLCAAQAASALNTFGTDMSDLWFNAAESGWGINIAHQREIVFATLFVYGTDNRTRWYVAPDMSTPGGPLPTVFNGNLYETQGPFLGGTFNPTAVTNRQVGTARLTFNEVSRGTLVYTVDGVSVTKQIERQTFRGANLAGIYRGSAIATVAGCSTNGFQTTGLLSVTHNSANAVSILASLDNGFNCTYTGTYAQAGRMGAITGGSFTCTQGPTTSTGTFQASEIEAGYGGMIMRYETRY
ncbi:MAG: hypothetical protein ACJ8B6_04010, partial [Gemmatimonadales bacterium]